MYDEHLRALTSFTDIELEPEATKHWRVFAWNRWEGEFLNFCRSSCSPGFLVASCRFPSINKNNLTGGCYEIIIDQKAIEARPSRQVRLQIAWYWTSSVRVNWIDGSAFMPTRRERYGIWMDPFLFKLWNLLTGDWASWLCRLLEIAECEKLIILTFLRIPIDEMVLLYSNWRLDSEAIVLLPELSHRNDNAFHYIMRFAAVKFWFLLLIRVLQEVNGIFVSLVMDAVILHTILLPILWLSCFSCQICWRFRECHNHDWFYLPNVFSPSLRGRRRRKRSHAVTYTLDSNTLLLFFNRLIKHWSATVLN